MLLKLPCGINLYTISKYFHTYYHIIYYFVYYSSLIVRYRIYLFIFYSIHCVFIHSHLLIVIHYSFFISIVPQKILGKPPCSPFCSMRSSYTYLLAIRTHTYFLYHYRLHSVFLCTILYTIALRMPYSMLYTDYLSFSYSLW